MLTAPSEGIKLYFSQGSTAIAQPGIDSINLSHYQWPGQHVVSQCTMLLIISSATSFLVFPALLPGAELMSLQKTPLGCRETPFCSDPSWGFLNGVAQHHRFMQGQSEPLGGSLMCITLHHRNMQISTSSELMHQGGNC